MGQRDWRRVFGNAFIAIGVVVLLGIGGAWGWEQWQARQLRERLASEPTVQAMPAALPTSTATLTVQSPATPPPTSIPAAPAVQTEPPPPAAATAASAVAPATARATVPAPAGSPDPGVKPVRLRMPDLKIDVPVGDMTWTVVNTADGPQSEWQIPESAAGHAVNSALLGQPDNVVLSGHNNIYGRVFLRISQAWPESDLETIDAFTERSHILDGRQIEMQGADGRRFAYVVAGFYRVKDTGVPPAQRLVNAHYMDPTDHAQLTLTTCWPPWSNTHRLIVIAEPLN